MLRSYFVHYTKLKYTMMLYSTQLFQSFFSSYYGHCNLQTESAQGPIHLKCISRWEGRDGVTITIFFQHTRDGHETTYLQEDTHIKIQRRLEAFLGFLVKIKMKAYKKLTVVVCCQIVAKKSVAPSSGNFWRRSAPRQACGPDQEF